MSVFKLIKQDLSRYKNKKGRLTFDEPSWIVVLLYRLNDATKNIKFTLFRWICNFIIRPFYLFFSILFGIEIPRGACIGGGLKIYHFGGIVINPATVIGKNCSLRQGVTIGNKNEAFDVPVIGDNVDFGAGCKVLGNIKIGNNVSIGANAVVLCDVPDNCIAVGIPARVIPKKEKI